MADILKLILLIAGVVLTALIGVNLLTPRDDTDLPKGRGGMSVLTDHATGCQYLRPSGGGLTPRLDREGRHMGCVR